MALPTPFAADFRMNMLAPDRHFISTPRKDFDHEGALKEQGETWADHSDFCQAIRAVGEAVEDDQQLAEHIAVLLNRACAYGRRMAAQG